MDIRRNRKLKYLREVLTPAGRAWIKYVAKNPRAFRFYIDWLDSLNGERSPVADQTPWMGYDAIEWLDLYLHPGMTVFEWGSGGSTLFFSKRVSYVVSIEHDPWWYHHTKDQLARLGIRNVFLALICPETISTPDTEYSSTDRKYKGQTFQAYASSIDLRANPPYDLVLVDGRARVACIKHARANIKSGGYLMLDDSEREEYEHGKQMLCPWGERTFRSPAPYVPWFEFHSTSVWQNP